jgi:hypothetical protein
MLKNRSGKVLGTVVELDDGDVLLTAPSPRARRLLGDPSDCNHSGPFEDRMVPGQTSGTAGQAFDLDQLFCRCHLRRAAGSGGGATCAYTR